MNTKQKLAFPVSMTLWHQTVVVVAILASFAGCGFTVTEHQVRYAEMKAQGLSADQAFGGVTSRLVNLGYDIKHSDKDAGVVISEYRAVAQSAGNPPFDTYLQFRTTIQERKDGVTLRLTPAVKSQNRLNLLASSEVPLVYYTGEPANVSAYIKARGLTGITHAYSAFEAVVGEMAGFAKVPMEQVDQQVQSKTVKSR